MRTFAVLSYSESENLGDEIQSIAAAQFLPRVDTTVDRDHLRQDTAGRTIDAILNGWFLIGEEWPPPDGLHPLLVSFYAPPEHARVYDRRHLEWYRRHEPIGCRSIAAVRGFEAIGVHAYFSGCLSLCLPPAHQERGAEVCIVDCDARLLQRLVPSHVLQRATFLTHVDRTDAHTPWRRVAQRGRRALGQHAPRLAWAMSATYRRHRHAERMARAHALLARYTGAHLVITGRLHCFLPCLALGTPVLFLHPTAEAHRFAGLAELGHAYSEHTDRIDMDWNNPAPNPGRHHAIAVALAERCRTWVAQGASRGHHTAL